MSPLQRTVRNLLFYLIVIGGGVLSIVSIIVVLELRGPASVPEELSVTALRQSLDTTQAIYHPHRTAVIPVADSTLQRVLASDTTARARTVLRLFAAQRSAAEAWNVRRGALLAGQAELAAATVGTWRVDAGRTGHREREARFMALREWYRAQAGRTGGYLDSGQAHLAAAYASAQALREARIPADVAAREAEARAHLAAVDRLLARPPAVGAIPLRDEDERLFARGFEWHPFAALSGWLRSQRSMELASIIGMLGFGLLGACVSTAVRQRRNSTGAPTVMGENLTHLLLSGVSAALATYLAVKGGLAVVSAEGAEPNPYVLLLTCFVAAVYWEEAWERVRKLVSSSDGDEPGDAGGNAPHGPPPGQQQPNANPAPNDPPPAQEPVPNNPAPGTQPPIKVPGSTIVSDATTPVGPPEAVG